jgi:glyoxylase-like metal-dependent hydrolase (beta-lactamase superfamily II)
MIHDFGSVIAVDTFMHGIEGITAVYYLPGPRPAIIEAGPASSLDATMQGLEEAGVDRLDWIVLTHIHLDHAGAVGQLAQRFPEARVVVRTEGAPHLTDPSRLIASAARLYPNMDMWGPFVPVPEERIDAISADSPIADLGDGRRLDAVYAPGHAKHQMAIFDRRRGDVFAGDAVGVRLPEIGVTRPATPPPEFDLELSIETVEKIRSLRPARVFPTHFGPVPEVNPALDEAILRFNQWVGAAKEVMAAGGDVPEIAAAFRSRSREFYPGLTEETQAKLEGTTSYLLNAAGIARYLKKKAEGR